MLMDSGRYVAPLSLQTALIAHGELVLQSERASVCLADIQEFVFLFFYNFPQTKVFENECRKIFFVLKQLLWE